ncbi:reactive oxygen species modulator [Dictyostelium discoideum AX4]|uniref:Reactive oxygen species modulator 1 homolog n=1 Tax=Dictyostelium discoideum TaxID=44689 RepID=ROMO1_DICDI|nr:reactive oxygen species modulator [Dictyostelium discoideum AX4]Q54M86.1 RecName: Full=Reactive oxygen species modulator 1 homolog; Short=ROS modulator 1 homolog; AltName: Full=Protein MGR2 homolog [Dictyostelium discoideum]EAL64383.1 reactive oxygen species modulator [Dictyostelium discoideum AX4]|eukprot:XP_637862.1 reactive oxygen species modulator [Dictyostelium discoideum AX4]
MSYPKRYGQENNRVLGDANNQCIQSIKMGFLMGAGVGATFGSCIVLIMFAAKKLPRAILMKTLGSSAMKMGGMFGCFMGIGGALRCEVDETKINKNNKNNNNNNNNIHSFFKNSNTEYDISKFNKTKF